MKKKTYLGNNEQQNAQVLKTIVQTSAKNHYNQITAEISQRIEKELSVITSNNSATHFLIAHDLCNYAKAKHIKLSAYMSENCSIVNFLLGITEVDPIKFNLPFERFINIKLGNESSWHFSFNFLTDADAHKTQLKRYLLRKYGGECALKGAYLNKQGKYRVHGASVYIDKALREKVTVVRSGGHDLAFSSEDDVFCINILSYDTLRLLGELEKLLDDTTRQAYIDACSDFHDNAILNLFQQGDVCDLPFFGHPKMQSAVKNMTSVTFDNLVILIAMMRPTYMDMIEDFVAHNCSQEIVKFIFQEDIINYLAQHGFTMEEAACVRWDIFKDNSVDSYKKRYVNFCISHNTTKEVALATWYELVENGKVATLKAIDVFNMLLIWKLAYFKTRFPAQWHKIHDQIFRKEERKIESGINKKK